MALGLPSDLLSALGAGGPSPHNNAGSAPLPPAAAPSGGDDKGLDFKGYVNDMISDAKAAHDMADDQEDAADLTKVLALLQGIKTREQKENDAALGGKVSPSVLRKAGAGGGSY